MASPPSRICVLPVPAEQVILSFLYRLTNYCWLVKTDNLSRCSSQRITRDRPECTSILSRGRYLYHQCRGDPPRHPAVARVQCNYAQSGVASFGSINWLTGCRIYFSCMGIQRPPFLIWTTVLLNGAPSENRAQALDLDLDLLSSSRRFDTGENTALSALQEGFIRATLFCK